MPSFTHAKRSPESARHGLTLIELLVVMFVVAIAILLLFPGTGSRPLSKQLICATNLKGLGTSCKLYATDNLGVWPTPGIDENAIGSITYTVPAGSGAGTAESPARNQQSLSGPGGAKQLSTTRAMWMLVRSGDETVKQFVCPMGDDEPDETEDLELYYDFAAPDNISYGYQVPFGPKHTRAREGVDNRIPLIADRGPYRSVNEMTPPAAFTARTPQQKWAPYNSPNHKGEGQYVLYADGHVTFERTPIVGVDHDNIYTAMISNGDPASFIIGESPWKRNAHPFAPIGEEEKPLSSTDSLIFP